ncbi:MAG: LPS export ABC transporter ATP-binding protein [Fimbriimonadaceae bacterium]
MKVTANNLVKIYKKRRVVNDVSVEFTTGEIVGLLGPNGAGKTTTFYMITGLVRPNQGNVMLDQTDITRWPMHRRARAGLGYLAQESSVFRRLSVEDNIRLVLEARGLSRKIQDERIDRLCEELSISKLRHSMGGVLSGGERRRVEIARAMATEPHFILLDEPFTGIDPVTIEELQHIIERLAKQGIGILITDHNVDATLNITDRNYILVDGEIIATGDQATIRSNELVRKHYLGQGYDQISKERHQKTEDTDEAEHDEES